MDEYGGVSCIHSFGDIVIMEEKAGNESVRREDVHGF
jgi:hypothetical protein